MRRSSVAGSGRECRGWREILRPKISVTPTAHNQQMNERYRRVVTTAARQHGAISIRQLTDLGVGSSLRHRWVAAGLLHRYGPRAFVIAGSASTWHQSLTGGFLGLDGHGCIAGRSSGRLHHLDGFNADSLEYLVPRAHRSMRAPGLVSSSIEPFRPGDIVSIDGLRALSAERLIVESANFNFSRAEISNAIDSAIRLRLLSESRLRDRVLSGSASAGRRYRDLLEALTDTGGESSLERRFLAAVREAGLPRPATQRIFRDGSRTVARVDFCFPGNLVVEVSGHTTHSSRMQVQNDARRHTELSLAGNLVLTFTRDDVVHRATWMLGCIQTASTLQVQAAILSPEARSSA